jgi:sensor histidine kinase YesM
MIIALVIVNFGGFYLGKLIGKLLRLLIENTYKRGGITTFTATVLLGFFVLLIISLLKRSKSRFIVMEINTYWILLVFTVIIVARQSLVMITSQANYAGTTTLSVIIDYTFCTVALCYLAINAVNETRKAQKANEMSNITNYSYIRLQQQVKPHFMFNNLNILNSLVIENKNQEASSFIYKLAYLYRYMIENEEESLVTIREELDFVNEYTDLMKVRFGSSFDVVNEIDEEILPNFVVPCSIQLLIENAIKHNGGTTQTPLNIRMYNTATHIVIWNNRLKKNTCEPTTHIGLNYIQKLYSDLSPKEMTVESTEEEFIVRLPIIR